jgi:Icc protein
MLKKVKQTFLVHLLFLIIIVSFTACKDSSKSFTFVFMTDIHLQPETRADEGFRSAIEKVNELNPDFVITGGDLIMDALAQTEGRADSLYDLYEKIVSQFNMPVYNTLGNHEVFGLYENSGIAPEHPEYGKKMFKNRLGNGNTYYSFDHKGWHFIILDGIGFTPERRYYGHIDSLQLDWLTKDIAKVDQNTPVVLSTHIPLFSIYGQMKNGPTFANGQGSVVTNALDVMKVLENHQVNLVLQGHLHVVEEIRYGNTTYITGGAVSAAWWKGPREGHPEGFTVVQVEKDQFSWKYMTYGWQAENTAN